MEIFLNLSGIKLKAVDKAQIACQGCAVRVVAVLWLVLRSLTVKPTANVIILLAHKRGGLERSLKRQKGLTQVSTVSSSSLKLISGVGRRAASCMLQWRGLAQSSSLWLIHRGCSFCFRLLIAFSFQLHTSYCLALNSLL